MKKDKESTYNAMVELVKDYMESNGLDKKMSTSQFDHMTGHLELILAKAIHDLLV